MQHFFEKNLKNVLTKEQICVNINVSIPKQKVFGGEDMQKRKIKHPEYYAISAHMTLARRTSEECANLLGISARTYKEKIKGFSDFSADQGRRLSEFLGVTQEQLFLTENVSSSTN